MAGVPVGDTARHQKGGKDFFLHRGSPAGYFRLEAGVALEGSLLGEMCTAKIWPKKAHQHATGCSFCMPFFHTIDVLSGAHTSASSFFDVNSTQRIAILRLDAP